VPFPFNPGTSTSRNGLLKGSDEQEPDFVSLHVSTIGIQNYVSHILPLGGPWSQLHMHFNSKVGLVLVSSDQLSRLDFSDGRLQPLLPPNEGCTPYELRPLISQLLIYCCRPVRAVTAYVISPVMAPRRVNWKALALVLFVPMALLVSVDLLDTRPCPAVMPLAASRFVAGIKFLGLLNYNGPPLGDIVTV
jgi:hypothetical protein